MLEDREPGSLLFCERIVEPSYEDGTVPFAVRFFVTDGVCKGNKVERG